MITIHIPQVRPRGGVVTQRPVQSRGHQFESDRGLHSMIRYVYNKFMMIFFNYLVSYLQIFIL